MYQILIDMLLKLSNSRRLKSRMNQLFMDLTPILLSLTSYFSRHLSLCSSLSTSRENERKQKTLMRIYGSSPTPFLFLLKLDLIVKYSLQICWKGRNLSSSSSSLFCIVFRLSLIFKPTLMLFYVL